MFFPFVELQMTFTPLPSVITSKEQMYQLLQGGAFGNTTRQYLSLDEWFQRSKDLDVAFWGVRTMTPGGPCRLYCPDSEVASTARDYLAQGHRINISMMVDAVCTVTLWADVYDSETGLTVYGVEYPGKGASWRKDMSSRGRQYSLLESRMLLQRHLNPSSLADLEELRELWPGHVYELSACNRCLGTIPGRNAVIWEVRCGSGQYEAKTWR
jgi:hypothetical protein